MGKLNCCDNLDIMRRQIKDESVDLIYLDPPFNSKTDYDIFITLEVPTDKMRKEALFAGFLKTVWEENIQRIQIFTVEELIGKKKPELPSRADVFEKAEREKRTKSSTRDGTTLEKY